MSYGTYNTLRNIFEPTPNNPNASKTGLVFASRKLSATNQLILPLGNAEQPSPYIPFKLSAFKDGISALAALAKLGFKYKLGSNFKSSLPAPDSVVTDSVAGIVYLTWLSTTTGLEQLASSNPTGSITQQSVSALATIKKVETTTTATVIQVVMINGSPAFTTTGTVDIDVTLSFAAPDPENSDEVCVFAFWYFQKYATQAAPFNTSPDLWISTLIDGVNTSISPQSTPIQLAASSVAILADDSVNLTYPITAENLGLLPTAYFGSSVVNQGTEENAITASGTFNGFKVSNSNVIINVTNVTGTFNSTLPNTVKLDVSRNGATLLGNVEIGAVAMCYPVPNKTTSSANHADFEAVIIALRTPEAVRLNKFNVIGYYGFVPSYIGQYPLSAYTAPDTMAFCFTLKADIPTVFQYPCNTAMVVAQSMFTDLNNDPSYEADAGEQSILNLTVSNNKASWLSLADCEQLTKQGITVVAINENISGEGIPYWYQRVCTYQTQSGTDDIEYRYMSLQLKKRWLDKNIELANRKATINPTTGQRRNNDPLTIGNVKSGGISVLTKGVGLGICGSIGNDVTVELQVGTDVTRLLETVTTSLVSQNNGVDAVVYINSFAG